MNSPIKTVGETEASSIEELCAFSAGGTASVTGSETRPSAGRSRSLQIFRRLKFNTLGSPFPSRSRLTYKKDKIKH